MFLVGKYLFSFVPVCSTFGIATEQADHDSMHKMKIQEPSQIINPNNTDVNMKTLWTNVYNYRLSKDFNNYNKNDKEFDEIFNEDDRYKNYNNEVIRQYNLNEKYHESIVKKRVKRDDDNKCEPTVMKEEGKLTHPHPKGSKNYYSNRDCLFYIQGKELNK